MLQRHSLISTTSKYTIYSRTYQSKYLIINSTRDTINAYKAKTNYKESYNVTLIHTHLTNIAKNSFGDTRSKIDSIVRNNYKFYLA